MTSWHMVEQDRRRRSARRYLPRVLFDYIDGGAEDEWSVERNRRAFRDVTLVPRVLTGVARPSLATMLLDEPYDRPFGVSPMGLGRIAGPGTDLALARAAAQFGMPYGLSMYGSTTLEQIAEVSEGRAWFQIYLCAHHDLVDRLIARARAAGYRTLVVTVDANHPAVRRRNTRNGFTIPFRMTPRLVADFCLHPGWSLRTLAAGAPRLRMIEAELPDANVQEVMRLMAEVPLNLEELRRVRSLWPGRLLVKGVMHPADVAGIVAAGADGIVVSNHGARQLGSVAPSIAALPAVRAAAPRGFPLLLDSGVRDGEDVLKALALGADFVLMGRPFLFAAACASPDAGVGGFVEDITRSLLSAMAQTGCGRIGEIGDALIGNWPRFDTGADERASRRFGVDDAA